MVSDGTLPLKCIIVFYLMICIAACGSEEASPDVREAMLASVNSIRAAGCICGAELYAPVQKLTLNIALSEAAFAHAQDMDEHHYFAHISPEGISPEQRVTAAGYQGAMLAENIAEGYTTVNEAVTAWLQSSSHCQALLTADATEMGIARVNSYWVLVLGKSN
jgi:uncharacterized protein YkwD